MVNFRINKNDCASILHAGEGQWNMIGRSIKLIHVIRVIRQHISHEPISIEQIFFLNFFSAYLIKGGVMPMELNNSAIK